MLELHSGFALDDGNDIEPYVLLAPVASDILVAEPYQVEPLLVVHGVLGLKECVVCTCLHLDDDQVAQVFLVRIGCVELRVWVERDNINLKMPLAIVALKDGISVVLEVLRGHLLPQPTQLQRLAPLLRRELVLPMDMNLQLWHKSNLEVVKIRIFSGTAK